MDVPGAIRLGGWLASLGRGTAVAARKAMRKGLFNLYILHKNYPELVCNCSFYVIY